jgi:CheY-like chemotaxis protein
MADALKILLVEDSADDVFFFRRAVNKAGIVAETHVAGDGVEAINYITNRGQFSDAATFGPAQVIFLDLKLPHVNGFEVLEWVRAHPEHPTPPIVVLTSSDEPEDRDRAANLGASLFLTKPPAPDQLIEALRNLARAKRRVN